MSNVTHPHLVRILEAVPAYPSGTYEIEVYGFGAPTREEADRMAAEVVAAYDKVPHATGPGQWATRAHRAVHATACAVCRVTGKKPGCKRKACEACGGKGTVPA